MQSLFRSCEEAAREGGAFLAEASAPSVFAKSLICINLFEAGRRLFFAGLRTAGGARRTTVPDISASIISPIFKRGAHAAFVRSTAMTTQFENADRHSAAVLGKHLNASIFGADCTRLSLSAQRRLLQRQPCASLPIAARFALSEKLGEAFSAQSDRCFPVGRSAAGRCPGNP